MMQQLVETSRRLELKLRGHLSTHSGSFLWAGQLLRMQRLQFMHDLTKLQLALTAFLCPLHHKDKRALSAFQTAQDLHIVLSSRMLAYYMACCAALLSVDLCYVESTCIEQHGCWQAESCNFNMPGCAWYPSKVTTAKHRSLIVHDQVT